MPSRLITGSETLGLAPRRQHAAGPVAGGLRHRGVTALVQRDGAAGLREQQRLPRAGNACADDGNGGIPRERLVNSETSLSLRRHDPDQVQRVTAVSACEQARACGISAPHRSSPRNRANVGRWRGSVNAAWRRLHRRILRRRTWNLRRRASCVGSLGFGGKRALGWRWHEFPALPPFRGDAASRHVASLDRGAASCGRLQAFVGCGDFGGAASAALRLLQMLAAAAAWRRSNSRWRNNARRGRDRRPRRDRRRRDISRHR